MKSTRYWIGTILSLAAVLIFGRAVAPTDSQVNWLMVILLLASATVGVLVGLAWCRRALSFKGKARTAWRKTSQYAFAAVCYFNTFAIAAFLSGVSFRTARVSEWIITIVLIVWWIRWRRIKA